MNYWFFWFRRKSNRRIIQGLTLVEVLVTMTILAMVAAGVGTSFFAGLSLWNRVKKVDFIHTEFALDLEMIARDIRQSVNITEIGFEGTAESFSFPAVENGRVVKVTYSADILSGLVTRRVQSLAQIIDGHGNEPVPVQVVFSVDKVAFQYSSQDREMPGWLDVWLKDNGIFRAVRLEGVYKGESFSRIFIVPVA